MRFLLKKIKIPKWRLDVWKAIIESESKSDIIDDFNRDSPYVLAFSAGVNTGLKMALDWFIAYVEGG